ncbi:CLUMA_CG005772, isoform A [Clunio marinus]|uniref:CLUMA_CG005772, isoform A n=1 Tax=Clunio marinus TaxID=568069 RepID=A0A1J1I1L4_9DIPT|nr:CLUMA_CG005772, isoform A [Clunio marinus]
MGEEKNKKAARKVMTFDLLVKRVKK